MIRLILALRLASVLEHLLGAHRDGLGPPNSSDVAQPTASIVTPITSITLVIICTPM
jgi:hypothetical protein